MIEVEAKYKISDPSLFRKRAASIGKYMGKEKKVDDYYTLDDLKNYPKKSIRIRKKKGYYEVNFKRSLSYAKGVHAKNEIEFRVDKVEEFIALIDDMGFRRWLRKDKTTEVYRIKERFHIEINFVKDLGWFIEIEYLAKQNEMKKAQKSVLAVAKKLGLNEKEIIKSGYTKQLWDKGKVL